MICFGEDVVGQEEVLLSLTEILGSYFIFSCSNDKFKYGKRIQKRNLGGYIMQRQDFFLNPFHSSCLKNLPLHTAAQFSPGSCSKSALILRGSGCEDGGNPASGTDAVITKPVNWRQKQLHRNL